VQKHFRASSAKTSLSSSCP